MEATVPFRMRSNPLKTNNFIFCMVLKGLLLFPFCADGQSPSQFRIGFSTSVFGEVNENDAIAAVRVRAQVIVRDRGIPADPHPVIFRNVAEISVALEKRKVDCINLTTSEYVSIREQVSQDSIVAGVISDSITEEYLLIAHRQSGIESLKELRGLTLGMLQSSSACLAPAWLDTLLAKEKLGRADDFFKHVFPAANVGKAVLPVFFRRMDACVATRKGFGTMVELNAQTGRQIEIVAASPPFVPTVFCFRKDCDSPLRNRVMGEIKRWHLSPPGRQIVTIFQTDRLEEHPVDCLDSALELLAQYRKLSGESNKGVDENIPGDSAGVLK